MFPLGNIGLKKFKIFFSILRYKNKYIWQKYFVGTWVDKKNKNRFQNEMCRTRIKSRRCYRFAYN